MPDTKVSISFAPIIYAVLIAIGSAIVANQAEILAYLLAITPDTFDPIVQYVWGAILAAIAIFIPSPIKTGQNKYYVK